MTVQSPIAPLVSVVIATKNRADMLVQSINSVLSQTFTDFELLIVDDGSTDNTKAVVESIADSRVRYLTTGPESKGISAARNMGADHSRGTWTAVHDDDDLMLPRRLEEQLRWANDSADFIYGAFINFDDDSGTLQLHHGRNMTYGAALKTGFAPGHSTWLVRTDLIRQFRYDEGLESAVDNNLVFRMLRSGIELVHSGVICLLRRVHSGRITDTGGAGQKYAATLNLRFLRSGVSEKQQAELWGRARYDWGPVDKADWQLRALPFLPDHLVARSGTVYELHAGENDNESRVERIFYDSIDWNEWYAFFSRTVYLGEVVARMAEDPALEALLESTAPRFSDDSESFRAVLAFEQSKNSGARYVVAIRGDLSRKLRNGEQFHVYVLPDHHVTAVRVETVAEGERVALTFGSASVPGIIFEMDLPDNTEKGVTQ